VLVRSGIARRRGDCFFVRALGRREISLEKLGARSTDPIDERRKNMNDQNRVLIRRGARDLSAEEMERVGGGLRTATFCSINSLGQRDGDTFLGEC
jgi:hypothetical protein